MPSLASGYAFDIFISYRQKDNKYDGWVTEFVRNLKQELESTFKGNISIYFDANPEDGLGESHDVDDSLKEKIKTVVFIPILSRTYCDENSFAWQKELLSFRDFAVVDPLGMKLKLANGNVASRILPIRIHDLDPEDIQLFEKETATHLRPIDFIYKSAGVNRPLLPLDDKKENLNHTFYRDQINKVAMAIKEIATAVKLVPARPTEIVSPPSQKAFTSKPRKFLVPALIVALIASVILAATGWLKSAGSSTQITEEQIDRSIAVLPFANMSSDKDQEYFSDGLSEEVLNVLAKVPHMKVISRTSAFAFKGKNEDIRTIASKLDVAYVLEGSVRKSADQVRITAQLIRASDGSHLWSETFDRGMNDIFKVQDEIAKAVVNALKVTLLGDDHNPKPSRPDVYTLWLQSKFYAKKNTPEGRTMAFEFAKKAVAADSTDGRALGQLALCYYYNQNSTVASKEVLQTQELGKKAATNAIRHDKNLTDGYRAMALILNSQWDIEGAARYARQAILIDSSNSSVLNTLAGQAMGLGQFQQARTLYQKTLTVDPLLNAAYANLAILENAEGHYQEAIMLGKKNVELGSNGGYVQIMIAQVMLGRGAKALETAQLIEDPFWRDYGRIVALWQLNKKAESQSILLKFEEENKEIGASQIAEMYSYRGDIEKAFEWLDVAFKYHDPGLTEIKSNTFFKVIRQDARYRAILKRLNLPLTGDLSPD